MLNREMVIQQFTVLDAKRQRYQMLLVRSWSEATVPAAVVRPPHASLRYQLITGEAAIKLSEHTFEVMHSDREDGFIVHRLR
ncbi:hypothetical protein [Massilia sp. YIM B04103]|uniref:hypothetical protein n=1 Tax=Massilia sp. YIM B04103 TaxID=2963106 RepID=UPI00210A5A12|nr:hypothetical protein [Massilia sp. YIM B04103]